MDRRIRVLQVVEATTGGTKQHVLSLVKGLDKTRFDVAVACPCVRNYAYGDTTFVDDLGGLEHISVILVDMRRQIDALADIRALMILAQVIKDGQYDIVHAHSSKAGVLARIAAKSGGGPAILYTPHGFAFRSVDNGLVRQIYVWIERLCGRWTDRIICVSCTEKEQALGNCIAPASKLSVIENGVDLGDFVSVPDSHSKRQELGLGPSSFVVGTAGRISRDKGVDCFLTAAAKVSSVCPAVQFLIIGDGEAREDLELLAERLGIDSRAIFTGFRRDNLEVIGLVDLFVLASPHEALPYAVLEAMAHRKPVIAINGTGAQDAIQHRGSGLLVPPRAPEALANAIVTLLQDKAKARAMGGMGRKIVEARFTLEKMIARTEGVYQDLFCQRSISSPSTMVK